MDKRGEGGHCSVMDGSYRLAYFVVHTDAEL